MTVPSERTRALLHTYPQKNSEGAALAAGPRRGAAAALPGPFQHRPCAYGSAVPIWVGPGTYCGYRACRRGKKGNSMTPARLAGLIASYLSVIGAEHGMRSFSSCNSQTKGASAATLCCALSPLVCRRVWRAARWHDTHSWSPSSRPERFSFQLFGPVPLAGGFHVEYECSSASKSLRSTGLTR